MMVKKFVIGMLIVILVGAAGVGVYDAYQGKSTLDLPDVNLLQSNAGGQGQGQGQGQQGRGQGQGPGQGQQGQGKGQGQQGQGYGDGSGAPQAMQNQEWVTLTGTVVSVNQGGMTVDTEEMGQLNLEMGPPYFAGEQEVTYNPGDTVTVLGFEGEGGMFQAGQVTNDTTGATLHLRDPNGRPLWAGRGQGHGGQGQGQGGGN